MCAKEQNLRDSGVVRTPEQATSWTEVCQEHKLREEAHRANWERIKTEFASEIAVATVRAASEYDATAKRLKKEKIF